MRILSMTATFGKLEHETLTLRPGLNILEHPNEWGKSTWCAFLAAMLYGIETRAHSTKAALADKERYAPWSGSPMSGQLEILWQGRELTIQRHTKGRVPLGEFRAFETKTGLPVPELTGENCGQLLLGVEKAVFLRSAFLKGSQLQVEQEESLRRRLQALVTTGDENATGDTLEKKLKELKNRIQSNRTTGLLPQAWERRGRLAQELQALQSLERQMLQTDQQIQKLEAHREALELHRQTMDYRAGLEAGQKAAQAQAYLQNAISEEARCREAAQGLPPRQQLEERLRLLTEKLETAPKKPIPPEETVAQARVREKTYRRLQLLGWLLAVLGPSLGWILPSLFRHEWIPYLAWGSALLCFGAGIWLLGRARRLGQPYRGIPAKQWVETARQAEQARLRLQLLTEGQEPQACLQRLRRELEIQKSWDLAREKLAQARLLAAQLPQEPPMAAAPEQGDTLSLTRQETRQQLTQTAAQLQQLQLRLGECRGQMAALGSLRTLQQVLEQENQRIAQLEETYAAVKLALDTLTQVRTELQRRFAPQIVKKTQEFFSRLTGGRYDQLAMEEDLRLYIRAEGEDTARPSLWRSEGTVDQLYLALRLAVASELMPGGPLILDDALVRFDDTRLQRALELLQQEAQSRQILLFTCQSREKALIRGGNHEKVE